MSLSFTVGPITIGSRNSGDGATDGFSYEIVDLFSILIDNFSFYFSGEIIFFCSIDYEKVLDYFKEDVRC